MEVAPQNKAQKAASRPRARNEQSCCESAVLRFSAIRRLQVDIAAVDAAVAAPSTEAATEVSEDLHSAFMALAECLTTKLHGTYGI